MVVVVTSRGDLTADWLIVELERRGADYLRFNTEDYPTRASLTWTPAGPTRLSLNGRAHELSAPLSIWYRRPVPPRVRSGLPSDSEEWAAHEAEAALTGVWRTQEAFWVNHPDGNARAESKLEQLQTAGRMGFQVPRSIVTNEPGKVRELTAEAPTGVVCKPLASTRLSIDGERHLFFTSQVDDSAEAFTDLGPEPYLFQELVPKSYDLRVTVIGDQVFATRIESQADGDARLDWRRVDPRRLRHQEERLPDELAERCRSLVEHYGLHFGALDLARRTDGGFCFFELNPNGQWAWLEQFTEQPLRACLADLLVSAHGKAS